MTIIEDTRQKKGEHEIKHRCFDGYGVELIRNKLPFGDYAKVPTIAIDTKANMDEIAGNICGSEHQRFKRECVRAKKAGCKLIFLIENTLGITSIDEVHNWINPRCIYNPKCVQGAQLEKAMKTMSERYGCEFYFCTPEESARRILELLELRDG
jgi:ribosome-associated protein